MKKELLTPTSRNENIDVLKGICILLIVITHYQWTETERLNPIFPFVIDMAVPIFMIITGFLHAKSYEKHNITSLEAAYSVMIILRKFIRYAIPFSMAWFVEESLLKLFTQNASRSLLDSIFSFLNGGVGAGGYYFPVMLQFIFVFPIIFIIILKYDSKGLFICFLWNVLYEMLQRAYGMNLQCYRVLFFRYIFIVAVGCYIAIGKKEFSKCVYLVSILGFAFIYAQYYLGYIPHIIVYWSGTSFLACFFIVPFAYILLKKLKLRNNFLAVLGKASYDIFLVQKIFYIGAKYMYGTIENRLLELISCIIICVSVGILFHYIEMPITKWIEKRIKQVIEYRNSMT